MMSTFPFDDFQAIFISEVKKTFIQFVTVNKEKMPYIFVISVPDYIAINHPHSYCITFNGNTIKEFEENGYSFNSDDPDDLYYKYNMEEWNEHSLTDNDFPKSNEIIFNYIIDNESVISDDQCCYTEEFISFRNEFFECLIRSLEQLKMEGFFNSICIDSMLINFYVREYYDEDEICQIFERLNTKKDLKQFKKWM